MAHLSLLRRDTTEPRLDPSRLDPQLRPWGRADPPREWERDRRNQAVSTHDPCNLERRCEALLPVRVRDNLAPRDLQGQVGRFRAAPAARSVWESKLALCIVRPAG